MKKVYMYTDGACKGNPGAGGYACILVYGENIYRAVVEIHLLYRLKENLVALVVERIGFKHVTQATNGVTVYH